MMDKPDERKREPSVSVDREHEREVYEIQDLLVPELPEEKKQQIRNPEIMAHGLRIQEVLTTDSILTTHHAWQDLPLKHKCEHAQYLSDEISKQTGEMAMVVDIGDIGEQEGYTIVRDQRETFTKLSIDKSRHPEDLARILTKVHVFDLQEKKFKSDKEYANSPEGIEVEAILKASGNRGDARHYLSTTQSLMISGEAGRAIESGRIVNASDSPAKDDTSSKLHMPNLSESTEVMREKIVNTLFADSRIHDRYQWKAMKGNPSLKRELFSDLNVAIAKLQGREPLPGMFGNRKTGLYNAKEGSQRYALINYKEIENRQLFLEAVGMCNLREIQEINLENPNLYTGFVTNAKIKDRRGEVHDLGAANFREIQWNKVGRETSGSDRISIHSNETILLRYDIVSAYGELACLEGERDELLQRAEDMLREDYRRELAEKRGKI